MAKLHEGTNSGALAQSERLVLLGLDGTSSVTEDSVWWRYLSRIGKRSLWCLVQTLVGSNLIVPAGITIGTLALLEEATRDGFCTAATRRWRRVAAVGCPCLIAIVPAKRKAHKSRWMEKELRWECYQEDLCPVHPSAMFTTSSRDGALNEDLFSLHNRPPVVEERKMMEMFFKVLLL